MASIYKVASGWRVQIARKGVRLSRTFATKSAAEQWALREERAIIDGDVQRWPRKTVGDALDRYEVEVSAKKRTHDAEWKRMNAVRRHYPALCAKVISQVTSADLAAWRDDRLKQVTPGSVQRDINLLRHIWNVARDEWQWHDGDPWKPLRLPGNNPPRDRLIGWREIRLLVRRCGYVTGQPPKNSMQCVAWAFLVSLRTAMRAGEVLSLSGETVDLDRRVVTLKAHKTVEKVGARQVPLTPQAIRLLRVIWHAGPLLPIAGRSLDALFRKARKSALLSGFTYHDARATALTHMAKRYDVMVLAKISGHRDLSLLLNTYYRPSVEQIAQSLAVPKR